MPEERAPDESVAAKAGPWPPPSKIWYDLDEGAKTKIWWQTGVSTQMKQKATDTGKQLYGEGPANNLSRAMQMAWDWMAGREALPACPEHAGEMRKRAAARWAERCSAWPKAPRVNLCS